MGSIVEALRSRDLVLDERHTFMARTIMAALEDDSLPWGVDEGSRWERWIAQVSAAEDDGVDTAPLIEQGYARVLLLRDRWALANGPSSDSWNNAIVFRSPGDIRARLT